MHYIQTGNCSKCGAPIYARGVWHSVLPPPPIYTCSCFGTTADPQDVATARGLERLRGGVPPEPTKG